MKKIKNFVIGGLENKIFNLVLFSILLVIAAYTAVLVYQTQNLRKQVKDSSRLQQESIDRIATSLMNDVLTQSMSATTLQDARIADGLFSEAASDVMMLVDYAEKLYDAPESFPEVRVEAPDQALDGTVCAQLLMESGVDPDDPAVAAEAGLIGNLADMMVSLYNAKRLNACYIGTENGLFLIVDDRSGAKFSEDGQLKDFPLRERPWYTNTKQHGKLTFSDVGFDAFNGEPEIVCSIPVYADGKLVAVVGADLFLDSIAGTVTGSGDEKTGFACIVNQNGHVIFSPDTQNLFRAEEESSAKDLRGSEDEELAAFVTEALKGSTGVRLVNMGDTAYYMCGEPIPTVGWALLSVIEMETIRQPVYELQESNDAISVEAVAKTRAGMKRSLNTILILLAAILVLGLASALVLAKRIVKPLNHMTKRISSLGGKNVQFMMEDIYKTGDEIEVLGESFALLSAKTVKYVEEIKTVTAEKERIGVELEMAKAIQASQLPHLFPAFPDRHEFDIYATMSPAKEVGGDFYDFFLPDRDHIGLVMADVSGKGVPAALLMMVARLLIRNRVQSGESPEKALANVSEQLLEGNESSMFVTVWLALVEISTGKGVAVNAGHEHPVLRRAGGKYEMVIYRHSPAVATIEGIKFRQHEFEMHPGDSLFVYTDGVAEATNSKDELFGTERILKALNRDPEADPTQVLHNVKADIDAFVADAEQFDDVTMMCFRYNGEET